MKRKLSVLVAVILLSAALVPQTNGLTVKGIASLPAVLDAQTRSRTDSGDSKAFLPVVMSSQARTPAGTATPVPTTTIPPSGLAEWSQFGANAQHTSYVPQTITNWSYRCAWNGYGTSNVITLPRIEPITGNGKIYVAAGSDGVYALNNSNCTEAWHFVQATVNSTVAYRAESNDLFVLATNGVLYRLDTNTGSVLGQYTGAANSGLSLAVTLISNRVIFASGQYVYALEPTSLALLWRYDAGARVDTPPVYAISRNSVIIVTSDLYVHAINNTNGTLLWRTKPTSRVAGTLAAIDTIHAEAINGYPAVAEQHGLVIVRYRLDWGSIFTQETWQPSNTWIRNYLTTNPERQNYFALSLDTGNSAFIVNNGMGGVELVSSAQEDQGRAPIIKVLPDGKEVAYFVCRGTTRYDRNWDSHLCEMVLDDATIPGLLAGYVRYIDYEYPAGSALAGHYLLTDEQVILTMAGDVLMGGHWQAGQTARITDRSNSLGSEGSPIKTTNFPTVIERENPPSYAPCTQNNATHSCRSSYLFYDESAQGWGGRLYTPGFWVHWGTTLPHHSEWSTFIAAGNLVIYKSASDAIFVLQGTASGLPSTSTPIPSTVTPVSSTPTPTITIP